MNLKSNLATALVLMLSAFAANATPIAVPNGSFESPGSATQTSTNTGILTGWVFNVKGGSAYGSESISSNFFTTGASTGSYAAFINNDWPDVTDTITSAASLGTIAPLTTYTLTLALGNRKTSDTSLYGSPGNISFSLLANGVAFATETVNNGTVSNGTFQDFTLTYTTTASSPIIGETLKLQLATLPEQHYPGCDGSTRRRARTGDVGARSFGCTSPLLGGEVATHRPHFSA
jgi:hypothetical protein